MSTDSIGSAGGRDWATLADWFAGIPGTLSENEIGEVYNDSLFTTTATTSFSGKTVGSFTITLRPATGEGFADSKNDVGFRLDYLQSQGAAFNCTASYVEPMITLNQAAMTIQGLQFRTTSGLSRTITVSNATSVLKDCIIDHAGSNRGALTISAGKAINCLVVCRAASSHGIRISGGATVLNLTAFQTQGSPTQSGFHVDSGTTNIAINCASFGFSTGFAASGWDASSDYNASQDTTGPGSNAVDSLTASDQFESTTNDWRLKTGAGLIDVGNTDATNAPNDIVGTVRGTGLDGDIGCWEFAAVAAAAVNIVPLLMRARRARLN